MKTLLLLLVFSTASFAGQKCTKDYFGNYSCYGTGQDYGYRSSEQKDYFGNSTWTDNKGNRTKCTYDYLGNYSCN